MGKKNIKKKDYRREAKVLFFDLEVSPSLGYYYGAYDVTPIKEVRPQILLSFAWKWLGDKGKPQSLSIVDVGTVDRYDDRPLVKKLWELLDEAQIVVGHNSKRFDEKIANAFFLRNNMNPPSWYQSFDTLQTARKYFKFNRNNLDYLGKFLCGDGKTQITYGDCWEDILDGNEKARKKASNLLKVYNEQDVVVLEKIYEKMLPFATNHPNMALAAGNDFICPRCGKEADFHVKSYRRTGTQVNAVQYQCSKCGGYVTRPLTKEEREQFAEEGRLKPIFRNITG